VDLSEPFAKPPPRPYSDGWRDKPASPSQRAIIRQFVHVTGCPHPTIRSRGHASNLIDQYRQQTQPGHKHWTHMDKTARRTWKQALRKAPSSFSPSKTSSGYSNDLA